jgi:aminopeptidase-like protein
MRDIIEKLWMKRRDIVSDGFDESLEFLVGKLPGMKICSIPSGTKCWTWNVPEKWIVRDAYIKDEENKILDAMQHPLHVISYSLPVNRKVSKNELMKHLYTNPKMPNAIPFIFKYYERNWGFCIQHNRLDEFKSKEYQVYIDSESIEGDLKVGEFVKEGETRDEIAVISHLCHPAQVNDDLSGVAVAVKIASYLAKRRTRYTFRFLFLPETIGSVAYLSQNEHLIPRIKCGIFLEMLGTNNPLWLQHSRQGNTLIDRVARYALARNLPFFKEGAFLKVIGNDEKVFNAPGVDIPTISLSRARDENGRLYPQYHTSADTPDIINWKRLREAKEIVINIIKVIDKDYIPEPNYTGPVFLSRYGLWVDWRENPDLNAAVTDIMYSFDGENSLFDICEKHDLDFDLVLDYADRFYAKKLIEKRLETTSRSGLRGS